MFLFFEGFQAQNVLNLFLFSMENPYLTFDVNNSFKVGDIGDIQYFHTTLEKCNVIYLNGISYYAKMYYVTKDDFVGVQVFFCK